MMFRTLLGQDLRLSFRSGWSSLTSVIFYLAVAVLVPFALGPDARLLALIAGGMAWIAALLAMLLTLERLFQPDLEDGTLEQWISQGVPLEILALAKILAHWLTTAVPLLMATPLVAVLLQLTAAQTMQLMLALLLGTPGLSALGALCAALAVSVRRAAVLISLLVLPLAVPLLIFGVAAQDAERGAAALRLLLAVSLTLLVIAPSGIKAALRNTIS
jgi:heme exporter protein B